MKMATNAKKRSQKDASNMIVTGSLFTSAFSPLGLYVDFNSESDR